MAIPSEMTLDIVEMLQGPCYNNDEVQQLKLEVEQLIDARTCVICMDKEILYLFMPCKHLVSCEKCALNPAVKECPVCRKTIQKRLKTYMS